MTTNRRQFIRRATALAAAQLVPSRSSAADKPAWSIGFDGVTEDLPPQSLSLEGKLPEGFAGTLYRNGPALYEWGGQRYQHWFDPDGMLQAFCFTKDAVTHEGRFVRTRRFVREEAAGQFLYGGAGTHFANERPTRNNDDGNVANINIQSLNGELLALWEAGAAYRIDPETLETRGQMQWGEDLQDAPFSAHPHFDETGAMWNIGSVPFTRQPMLVLYHVSPQGRLIKSRVQPLDFAGYMHDFVLTPRYLIAFNSSAILGDGDSFVDKIHWQPDQPSQLLVFDRNDFALLKSIDIDASFVFHFGNAWEEGGQLSFTACEYPDSQIVSTGMRRLARQEAGPYFSGPELTRYDVSVAAGRASKVRLQLDMEFPGYDRRQPFAAQPVFGTGGHRDSESSLPSAIVSTDPRTGTTQRFDYGEGIIVEEPIYVPGLDGGYLLHSLLDYRRRQSGVAILRARQLAEGPLAMARMERVLPLGFHGTFIDG